MDMNDFYGVGSATTAARPPVTNGKISASGAFSQSASGSIDAEGAPAVWFLLLVGASLLLMHAGDGR